MMNFIQRWLIAASVVLALALAVPAQTQQAGSSTSSSSHSTQTHHRRHTRHYSKRMHLPKGPTPDRITQIQSALARGGYYQGDPSGKWDANTIAAMQKFQSTHGLDATGNLDAPTLQKLGLGSDIAGVSAPKPEVPKCCSTPPASASPAPQPAAKPAPASAGLSAQSSAAPGNAAAAPSSAARASDSATGSDPKPPQH
jgi:hypothetical protein